ncbi:13092_t:CDS:2, partial [Funneliformis geosporum]
NFNQGKVAAEISRIGAGIATVDGESIDNASVMPNAGAVFGQLMQGDMSIEQFSTRIKKI